MAISALSLPIDIPWRRVCVSADMIDREFCDRQFPNRWRSSIAAFSYEPPADEQQYEDLLVNYLKVVCTITGFQQDPTEVGLENRRIDSYWNDPAVIKNYTDVVAQYYACYGAILEVAVAPGPKQRGLPSDQYPYFLDFDPKKRELYEVATDTGESMSRSLEDINVRKGMTTSDGHEVVDLFGGVSANVTIAGSGGGLTPQGQTGHRDMSQDDYSNVRTTDSAREARESFSHTTQLTQMYHQLDSYHLGTNRSVFFMLPRPHVIQSDITFVNGPRQIEGIQEFFFVVARPKAVNQVCIEAYLETAHIASEPNPVYQESADTVLLHIEKKLTEDRDCATCYGDDSYQVTADDSVLYTPRDGWEIDVNNQGGYQLASVSGDNILESRVTEIDANHAVVYGKVVAMFIDHQWPTGNEFRDGLLDMTVTIYLRKKTPDIVSYSQNLWLTGRGICCCDKDDDPKVETHLNDSVTYESTLPSTVNVAVGANEKINTRDSNNLRGSIARELRGSINSSKRYPRGSTQLLDTAFLGRTLSRLVRRPAHPDNNTVDSIEGMDDPVVKKIAKTAPRISRGRLLEMPLLEIVDRFGLTREQASHVRRASLGLTGELPNGAARWDRRSARGNTAVPDVVGLSLDEARTRIRSSYLAADHVAYADSPLPRDTVIDQVPAAGAELPRRSEVELKLASGASVRIPDLIGKSLSDAIVSLRAAGLTADPEIRYAKDFWGLMGMSKCRSPKVLRVEPKPRTFVTPNAEVMLELGGKENSKE